MPRAPRANGPQSNIQSKYWSFTINNPIPEDTPVLQLPFKYIVYQLELAPTTGTPHYQGYFELVTARSLYGAIGAANIRAAAGTWLNRANWSVTLAENREAARNYCMKQESRAPDAEPVELGTWVPGGQGRRSEGAIIRDIARAGGNIRDVLEHAPDAILRYSTGVDRILELATPVVDQVGQYVPYRWQSDVLTTVSGVPDDRAVFWYYDRNGNTGKSFLARSLIVQRGAISLSGRLENMAMAFTDQPIVLFDIPRTSTENYHHQVQFAESLKNGVVFSGKYRSVQKVFKVPHVIFFANFLPDRSLLSADRWRVYDVTDSGIGGAPVYMP